LIYCDQLTIGMAFYFGINRIKSIAILDPIPHDFSSIISKLIIGFFGCRVIEADFFVGNIRIGDNKSLYLESRKLASHLALEYARSTVFASKTLSDINYKYGRDTIVLHIARQITMLIEKQILQVRVAEIFSKREIEAALYLRRPTFYSKNLLKDCNPQIALHFYGFWNYLEMIFIMSAKIFRSEYLWIFLNIISIIKSKSNSSNINGESSTPAVLINPDGEISLDRSYRSVGHWIDADKKYPEVKFYIWGGQSSVQNKINENQLSVSILKEKPSRKFLFLISKIDLTSPFFIIGKKCLKIVMFSTTDRCEKASLLLVSRLLFKANFFSVLCKALNIRVFFTGDTFSLDSDALILCSALNNLTTINYQYSNLACSNVLMGSTTDLMLTFTPRYESLWNLGGIRPRKFVAVGYPYDNRSEHIATRALRHRAELIKNGASYVVCYFDENIGPAKYGLISPENHFCELRLLAKMVLRDRSIGVIFKSQFRHRSPLKLMAGDHLFDAALLTGRIIDLQAGTHRNTILPSEAAKASDITISNLVGATASLEAALAGVRSIIINPNGVTTASDAIYKQSQSIIFAELSDALAAIQLYRLEKDKFSDLGDWTKFIKEFDQFCDGNSSSRIRKIINEALS
jgi:hypothetical protein